MIYAFFRKILTIHIHTHTYKGLQYLSGEHISGAMQKGDPLESYYSSTEKSTWWLELMW